MTEVSEKIFKIMAATLRVPRESLDENSSMDNIKEWDSLKMMNLVVALEEEFEIEFDDTEVLELLNFKLIFSTITSKLP